jgi:hypothetical protein
MQNSIMRKLNILIIQSDDARCPSIFWISPNGFKNRTDQAKIQSLIFTELFIAKKPVKKSPRNNNIKPT